MADPVLPMVPPAPSPPSSRLKVLLLYVRDAYTTARHLQAAFETRSDVDVVAMGPGHPAPWTTDARVDVAALSVRAGSPDVVLVVDGAGPLEVVGLSQSPAIRLRYLLDTHLLPDRPDLDVYDHLFVAHRQTLSLYGAPDRVSWLPHAADPEIHRPLPGLPQPYDVAFVGGMDLAEVHWRRRRLLRTLLEAGLRVCATRTTGLWVSFIYAKAKLVFNCSVKQDMNMRLCEGAACGRPVLTDRVHPEAGFLQAGWKDGENVVLYEDETLVSQVQTLLADEARRHAIGQAALALITDAHTYAHRVQEMLTVVSAIIETRQRVHA